MTRRASRAPARMARAKEHKSPMHPARQPCHVRTEGQHIPSQRSPPRSSGHRTSSGCSRNSGRQRCGRESSVSQLSRSSSGQMQSGRSGRLSRTPASSHRPRHSTSLHSRRGARQARPQLHSGPVSSRGWSSQTRVVQAWPSARSRACKVMRKRRRTVAEVSGLRQTWTCSTSCGTRSQSHIRPRGNAAPRRTRGA